VNGGYDIVFVARSRTKYQKSTYIASVMEKMFSQEGMLSQEGVGVEE
jgi:hypothetical protein